MIRICSMAANRSGASGNSLKLEGAFNCARGARGRERVCSGGFDAARVQLEANTRGKLGLVSSGQNNSWQPLIGASQHNAKQLPRSAQGPSSVVSAEVSAIFLPLRRARCDSPVDNSTLRLRTSFLKNINFSSCSRRGSASNLSIERTRNVCASRRSIT